MSVVIDASLTLAWYFEDQSTPATDAVLDRVSGSGAVVPGLWRLEVANAFQTAVHRQRIDAVYRDASLAELGFMAITIDADPNTNGYAWSTTLRLAERFALTLYDAAYPELAQRRSLPLATLDRDLRTAAPAVNVELLGPVGFEIGAHALRATAATNALDHQADIAKMQSGLGTPTSPRRGSTITAEPDRRTARRSKWLIDEGPSGRGWQATH